MATTLTELKQFFQANKVTTLNELAMHFDTNSNAIRDMLEIWIKKGKLRKVEDTALGGCGKCYTCKMIEDEIYEWLDEQA
jgi:putative ferrous iron transport protein C